MAHCVCMCCVEFESSLLSLLDEITRGTAVVINPSGTLRLRGAWFNRLLRHPARKLSGSILNLRNSHGGIDRDCCHWHVMLIYHGSVESNADLAAFPFILYVHLHIFVYFVYMTNVTRPHLF